MHYPPKKIIFFRPIYLVYIINYFIFAAEKEEHSLPSPLAKRGKTTAERRKAPDPTDEQTLKNASTMYLSETGTTAHPETRSATPKQRLLRNTARYVIVCLFLLAVNCCVTPAEWWVAWVAAGWGLSLLLQWSDYLILNRR